MNSTNGIFTIAIKKKSVKERKKMEIEGNTNSLIQG